MARRSSGAVGVEWGGVRSLPRLLRFLSLRLLRLRLHVLPLLLAVIVVAVVVVVVVGCCWLLLLLLRCG